MNKYMKLITQRASSGIAAGRCRRDEWVGLLFLICWGLWAGHPPMLRNKRENKQTNQLNSLSLPSTCLIEKRNEEMWLKRNGVAQFVFADSHTEWNEVGGGGRRRQTSGSPSQPTGAVSSSFFICRLHLGRAKEEVSWFCCCWMVDFPFPLSSAGRIGRGLLVMGRRPPIHSTNQQNQFNSWIFYSLFLL